MASAELIVAKTALSGALFRADPRPCSRDDIESMLALLNSTIAECSPPNVQRCKQWALSNLIASSARIAAFCKYLVALAKSFGGEKDAVAPESKNGRVPSAKRRRLHLLYILNDILYHVKHRNHDEAFSQKLEPMLPALVRSAASFNNCPKHIRKIQDLIDLWEENSYFSLRFMEQLRAAVDEGPSSGEDARNGNEHENSASAVAKAAKVAPFVMPAMHGDPSTPWYDLPAGNWLPALEPNSTRPMSPSMIKPLVLSQGPADKTLVEAVKKLLVDVDKIYSKEANLNEAPPNVGRLGERVEIDEITGEIVDGDTYYGWSRSFCEKMKRRRRERAGRNDARGDSEQRGRALSSQSYGRSASRSRSGQRGRSDVSGRSPGRPAFKRPRLSRSPQGRSRDRSRSRNWSRSPSERSSRSPDRHRGHSYRRSRSRLRSRSRSRSHSRSRSRSRGRNRGYRQRIPGYDQPGKYRPRSPNFSSSPSRSRSWHRSPSPPARSGEPPHPSRNGPSPPNPPAGNWNQHHAPPPPPPPPAAATIPFPIPPIPLQPGFGGGFPVLPPPPPNYRGPWPPVPPPLPPTAAQQQNLYPGGNPVPAPFACGWPPPVPPPPPPPPPPAAPEHQSDFHQQGRGIGGYQGGGGRW
ncbi:hypothetical protein VTK56DRAFT_85 [Thermocarpiscus australiensis]